MVLLKESGLLGQGIGSDKDAIKEIMEIISYGPMRIIKRLWNVDGFVFEGQGSAVTY